MGTGTHARLNALRRNPSRRLALQTRPVGPQRKELKCAREGKTGAGARVVAVVKILGGVTERERVGNGNKSITIPRGNTTQRKLPFHCRIGLGTWLSPDFSWEL